MKYNFHLLLQQKTLIDVRKITVHDHALSQWKRAWHFIE